MYRAWRSRLISPGSATTSSQPHAAPAARVERKGAA